CLEQDCLHVFVADGTGPGPFSYAASGLVFKRGKTAVAGKFSGVIKLAEVLGLHDTFYRSKWSHANYLCDLAIRIAELDISPDDLQHLLFKLSNYLLMCID